MAGAACCAGGNIVFFLSLSFYSGCGGSFFNATLSDSSSFFLFLWFIREVEDDKGEAHHSRQSSPKWRLACLGVHGMVFGALLLIEGLICLRLWTFGLSSFFFFGSPR